MSDYTIFSLLQDLERNRLREEARSKIARMPDFEKWFLLGLLKHEEAERGQAGIEAVIAWIASREEQAP